MKPELKPRGTKRLKLNHDELLSSLGFKFYLRRYIKADADSFDGCPAPPVPSDFQGDGRQSEIT